MSKILNLILGVQTTFAQQVDKTTTDAASSTGSQVQIMVDSIFKSIPYWITGLIVIILSFVISRIVKSMVENKMTEAGIEEEHREIQIVTARAASIGVIIVGITAGLKIAGLDLTSILAAAAFGIGFAMQDLIMNFLAGIILLLQKQFTIGDWISVNGTEGVVKEIQSRYTIIKKWDGTKAIVPNADLFKNQVNSLTSNPVRRFTVDISVDLYADLKEVIDVIYAAIDKVDKVVKKPKPSIIVTQPGQFYNNLRVRCWVESKQGILKPTSLVIRQIHKDFYRRGWSWPYPTQTLILDKDAPQDVSKRTQAYIENHKKILKKNEIKHKKKQATEAQAGAPAQTQAPAQEVPMPAIAPLQTVPAWLQNAVQQTQEPAAVQPSVAPIESVATPVFAPQAYVVQTAPEALTQQPAPEQAPTLQSQTIASQPQSEVPIAPPLTVSVDPEIKTIQ